MKYNCVLDFKFNIKDFPIKGTGSISPQNTFTQIITFKSFLIEFNFSNIINDAFRQGKISVNCFITNFNTGNKIQLGVNDRDSTKPIKDWGEIFY